MHKSIMGLLAMIAALPAAAQTTNERLPVPLGSKNPATPQATQPTLVVEPVAMMIAACDADGDARVSRDELDRCVARSFAAVDTAHAGTLGYIAFADWAERYLGDRNALPSPFETDADGDNRISPAELTAKFDAIFARLDKDRDGVLTRAELLTIRADAGRGTGGRERR